MLRRSLMINVAFSLVSTAVMMSAMPSAHGLLDGLRNGFLAYAQDSALLAPLVHRTFTLR